MNNQEPNQTTQQALDDVFAEFKRDQETARKENELAEKGEDAGGYKVLPNGTYDGVVTVQPKTVSNEKSPNYGLQKYEVMLRVTDGANKGKTAYYHHVIVPHQLKTPPAAQSGKLEEWKAAVKICLEDADKLLVKCGVNTRVSDKNQLLHNIAENNKRRQVVNFRMKDGTPHVNYAIREKNVEDTENSLFRAGTAPDGNDAPIG